MTYATYEEWNLPRVIEISLKSALKPAKPVIGLPFGFLFCGDGNVYHLPRKSHRSRSQPSSRIRYWNCSLTRATYLVMEECMEQDGYVLD
jgi:hypothetical protein